MAYIGQGIKNGTFTVLDTSGNTYNGSNVTFNLGTHVSSPAQLLVSHDGVIQKPVTDYTIATGGTQITFTTEISGAVGAPMNRDINGDELILDADADTSITADTDDQIDIRVGGSDIATLTSSALTLKNSATADNSTFTVNLQTAEADIAQDDVLAKINFQAPDEGTGTDANLIAASIQATSEGDFSSSSNATKLEFMTGASEAATTKMSISSGGIVGMGATLPGDLGVGLHIKTADSGAGVQADADELVIEGSANAGLTILSGNTSEGSIHFGDSGASDQAQIMYKHDDDYMMFRVNNGERMRIASSGNVSIGSTSSPQKLFVYGSHDTDNGLVKIQTSDTSANDDMIIFYDGNGTEGGSISLNASANSVAYNTSSDYRLKENETAITDGITRIKQLKPYRFNWKSEPKGNKVDGFFAHEVSSIVPEAILGEKDAVDGEGNIKNQKIDQSKLVPLLTAAIIELEARVKTLEDA